MLPSFRQLTTFTITSISSRSSFPSHFHISPGTRRHPFAVLPTHLAPNTSNESRPRQKPGKMCYYKGTRYTCAHTAYTSFFKACRTEAARRASPGSCPPCEVKVCHPLNTVSVGSVCESCQRMDDIVKRLRVALGSFREKVEEIKRASVRLRERRMKEVEEAAGCDEARTVDVERENKCEEEDDGWRGEFPNVRSSW